MGGGLRRSIAWYVVGSAWLCQSQIFLLATALIYMLRAEASGRLKQKRFAQLVPITIPHLPPLMFVCRMSVQADGARAKVIHCKTLNDKQKAKMLLLINTQPDATLLVFTGVPDSLLGHTLSMFLEGTTAGTAPSAQSAEFYSDTPSAEDLYLSLLTMICKQGKILRQITHQVAMFSHAHLSQQQLHLYIWMHARCKSCAS